MTVAATLVARGRCCEQPSARHSPGCRAASTPRREDASRFFERGRSLAHPKTAATVRATKFPAELRENLPEELLPMLEWEMETVEQGAWQRNTVDAAKL